MHIRNLYHIRESLNFDTRKLLIINFVLSTLDYCNILLINCSDKDLRPLKLILNRCIRFIFHIRFRQHVTSFYKKLHFLTIRKRIQFKACLLAHKIFYSAAPDYLLQEFKQFVPNLEMSLRRDAGRDNFMFDTMGDDVRGKQINYSIKRQWNSLPRRIRECSQICIFKRMLKTELFSNPDEL